MDFKPVHTLLLIITLAVGGTWGAIKSFAERPFAEETRQMVVMMEQKDQLQWYLEREWEIRKQCVNIRSKEWLCTDEDKMEYDDILLEIELLKQKLGINKEG